MDIRVNPSHISGTVAAPPSKSLTQRAVAAGLLAGGTTVIRYPSFCNDSLAAIRMAESLGALISTTDDIITVQTGLRPVYPVTLHCGESGLALRMFAPIAHFTQSLSNVHRGGFIGKEACWHDCRCPVAVRVTVVANDGFLR